MGGKGTKICQATMRHQGEGNSGHSEFDGALIARLDAQCRIVPYISKHVILSSLSNT